MSIRILRISCVCVGGWEGWSEKILALRHAITCTVYKESQRYWLAISKSRTPGKRKSINTVYLLPNQSKGQAINEGSLISREDLLMELANQECHRNNLSTHTSTSVFS